MIFEKVNGIYKKINSMHGNVFGTNKLFNKKIENVDGIQKNVLYRPWILVKDGRLINNFHLVFINEYNQTLIDLKDYTKVYENQDGVWIELTKKYSYTGYLPSNTGVRRFLLAFSVSSFNDSFTSSDYKMVTTYRHINYQSTAYDTLWGMFPFTAGVNKREDYHADVRQINGTWTTKTSADHNEIGTINGKRYATIAGLQSCNAGNRTITYNSMKLCIKDFYAYKGELN